jgi:hypothetical protein
MGSSTHETNVNKRALCEYLLEKHQKVMSWPAGSGAQKTNVYKEPYT